MVASTAVAALAAAAVLAGGASAQREAHPLEGAPGRGFNFPLSEAAQREASGEQPRAAMTLAAFPQRGAEGQAADEAVMDGGFGYWLHQAFEMCQPGEPGAEERFPRTAVQRFVRGDGLCAATLVSDRLVLTSRHCLGVTDANDLPAGFWRDAYLAVGTPGTGHCSFKARFARAYWSKPEDGFAILQLADGMLSEWLGWYGMRWPSEFLFASENATMVGFDLEGGRLVDDECEVFATGEDEAAVIEHDCGSGSSSPPMAGSPLLTRRGRVPLVIGMHASAKATVLASKFYNRMHDALAWPEPVITGGVKPPFHPDDPDDLGDGDSGADDDDKGADDKSGGEGEVVDGGEPKDAGGFDHRALAAGLTVAAVLMLLLLIALEVRRMRARRRRRAAGLRVGGSSASDDDDDGLAKPLPPPQQQQQAQQPSQPYLAMVEA